MFGKSDFAFPKHPVSVFVDGCFWHGCPLHATKPQNNAAFWQKRFARNTRRGRLVSRMVRRGCWRVLRIWEHELARKNEARLVARLRAGLKCLTSSRLISATPSA